jgi:hypothetical protein
MSIMHKGAHLLNQPQLLQEEELMNQSGASKQK